MWCKENLVKLFAIEEPSEVQYLSAEENGNAISTEMMLITVYNHLETFPVHFSYSDWIYVVVWTCCVSAQWLSSVVSKQFIPSCTSLAAACGFLWTSDSFLYSFGMNVMPVAWLKTRPKVMADVPPMYLQESNVLEKNSREKSSRFLGRFLYTM